MTTKITFLNGLDTIGGNIVSFSEADTRILMDFGTPGDPREEDSIADLINKGILPDTPELFEQNGQQKFQQQAIFISHLHIDHIGALKFLKPKLPIYMSRDSKKLYQSLIKEGDEVKVDDLVAVDYEKTISFGPFKITFYQSDHDIIGAAAIKVEDDNGHVFCYSGDVRYNGPFSSRVDNWTDAFSQARPDIFLLEGTSFSFDDEDKKEDHLPNASKNVEGDLISNFENRITSNHLVVINPYPRNVERLFALDRSAAGFGRPIVWERFYANLIREFFPQAAPLVLGKDVDISQIISYPENFVLQNSYKNIDLLKDFYKPIFLQMNGEPLGDYDPRYSVQQEKLKKFGADFVYAGASGHALKNDLVKIAKRVDAKVTVPWHSFKPEKEADALKQAGLKTELFSKNQSISF